MPRVAFLDRDGTLNVDLVRSVDVARLRLVPRAAEGVRLLNDAGWRTVVVTNQAGIGRGLYAEEDMHAFHRALEAELSKAADARIDGWVWCPHRPDEGCACRKPKSEMLERAMRELRVEPADCVMIGDSWRDVVAARRAGVRAAWVPSGPRDEYARECLEAVGEVVRPDFEARDLVEAAAWAVRLTSSR